MCRKEVSRIQAWNEALAIFYSREELLALRSRKFARAHFHQLKCFGLLRYRGPRLNNRGRNNTRIRPIPTIINYRPDCRHHSGSHNNENLRLAQRSVNFGALRCIEKLRQPKVYGIPTILSTNVRSLPKKVDEIQQIAELNSAGAICITESWLSLLIFQIPALLFLASIYFARTVLILQEVVCVFIKTRKYRVNYYRPAIKRKLSCCGFQ